MSKKIIMGIVCIVLVGSSISLATGALNNPPNIPSNPHPEDGALDIGIKTHLSWTANDPDQGDKARYDLYFGTEPDPGLLASDLEKPTYYPGVLDTTTQYFWKIIATDDHGASTTGPVWTFTTNDCDCDPPEKPSGPTRVRNRQRYQYSTKIVKQNQNGWYYNFSWGDGNHTGWLGPYNYTERVRAEHQWQEQGTYQVQARARFMQNITPLNGWIETGWSDPLEITVETDNPTNNPPTIPQINGPPQGKPGTLYEYTFVATDPEGDDIYYVVNWGCCGSETHTYGPYASGMTATVSHSWQEQGTFTVSVTAKDVYDAEGPTATLTVTMPRYRDTNGTLLMQRIRNMICDMLGICQGGCELIEITGILTYDGTMFFISDTELHFGPQWYITTAMAAEDYDGDSVIELVYDELQGLVGTEITVTGHMQSENWMSVFTINDMVYREPGQPIWAWHHQWRWQNHNNHP